MKKYSILAKYYDLLTENVEYDIRAKYISKLLSNNGVESSNILDIACGTATLSLCLSNMGYNVTAMDLSQEMLVQASVKSNGKITLLKGDMTDFEFSQNFSACICTLDSINHLTDIQDVKKCFDCVYNSLEDGGIFIFDVNTVYKHECVLADNTFVFDEEDFFLSWDNEFIGDNSVRILLDFFVFNGKNYDRYSEEFIEKAYTVDEIKSQLSKFKILAVYDDMSFNEPDDKSQRIYFVCKKGEI